MKWVDFTVRAKLSRHNSAQDDFDDARWADLRLDKHAEHVTCVCGQVVSKRGLNSHLTMKARFGHPCSADTPPPEDDLLYDAWCVIANAPGWETDTEWRRAAIRWRNRWHETLPSDDWPEEATRNTEEYYGFEPGQKVGDEP